MRKKMQLTVENKHRHKSIYRDVGIGQVGNQGPALWVLEEVVHSEGLGGGSVGKVLVCKLEGMGSDPRHQPKAGCSSIGL